MINTYAWRRPANARLALNLRLPFLKLLSRIIQFHIIWPGDPHEKWHIWQGYTGWPDQFQCWSSSIIHGLIIILRIATYYSSGNIHLRYLCRNHCYILWGLAVPTKITFLRICLHWIISMHAYTFLCTKLPEPYHDD